jgi:hypothetical protein
MKLVCLGTFFLCFLLAGCDRPQDEMEEMEKIVLTEDENTREWSLPEDRAVATGDLTPLEEED